MQKFVRLVMTGLFLSASVAPQTASAASAQWSMGYWSGFQSDPVTSLQWNALTHLIVQIVWPNTAADGSLTFEDQAGSLSSGQTTFAPFANSIISTAHANGVKVILGLNISTPAAWTGATSPAHLTTYVNNVASVVNTYGFDGIDIDWEGSINYTQMAALLSAVRTQLGSAKTLSASTGDGNIPFWTSNASLLDRMTIQTYDMAPSYTYAWFNAALFSDPNTGTRSVDFIENEWLKGGFPAAKLTLGIPFYGGVLTGVTAPRQTKYTFTGNQDYKQLAAKYNLAGSTWDSVTHEPWLPISGGYVTFDNAQAIADKVSYAKSHNLGGWIIFDLDGDYVPTQTPKHPLMAALATAMNSGATPPPSSCDINGDGAFNINDVQLCVSQALGVTTCSSCNLTQASPIACNAVDVQRDVNAALGGSCVVGP